MSVADFVAPTYTLKQGQKELTLHGLNPSDVIFLMSDPAVRASLESALDRFLEVSGTGNAQDALAALGDEKATELMMGLMAEMPALAAKIIAVAAGEPNADATIRKWSLALQVDALVNIGRLTFEDAGGFQAFVGNVRAVMAGLNEIKTKPALAATTGT